MWYVICIWYMYCRYSKFVCFRGNYWRFSQWISHHLPWMNRMVLILDGNSKRGARVWGEIFNLLHIKHLFRSLDEMIILHWLGNVISRPMLPLHNKTMERAKQTFYVRSSLKCPTYTLIFLDRTTVVPAWYLLY